MAKRELIGSNSKKRYIRRDALGRFTTSQDDVGRALTVDRHQPAKRAVKSGDGDRGDQKR